MRHHDVAIVGAGFSGAILAWILASQGRSVLLIDRDSHPRFAIGESSTPLADLILARLAHRYSLHPLASMATYGRWKEDLPQLTCGAKRGFSYFRHLPNTPFQDSPDHDASLLVTASASQQVSDTQWLRSDVDNFLVRSARAAGAEYHERTTLTAATWDTQWHFQATSKTLTEEHRWQSTADFMVDASGGGQFAAQHLPVKDTTGQLQTHSRASFAHFDGVESWSEKMRRVGWLSDREPFDADDAAQHHLLDDGWLWMLRFDNQCTSVGRVWSGRGDLHATQTVPRGQQIPLRQALGLTHYDTLWDSMKHATCVAPPAGMVTTGRLQRACEPVAGTAWAMLPTAAATIDPLHSTGIAHALHGVQHLAGILLGEPCRRTAALQQYAAGTLKEIRLVDALVSCSYGSMGCFRRFATSTMLYFIAAIHCEERYAAGDTPSDLWSVDQLPLMAAIEESVGWLNDAKRPTAEVESLIRLRLQPWNTAGLLDPQVNNRYWYTAAKKASSAPPASGSLTTSTTQRPS